MFQLIIYRLSFQFLRRREKVPGNILIVRKPNRQSGSSLSLYQLWLQLQEPLPELVEVAGVLLVPRDQLLRQQVWALFQAGDHRLGVLVLGTQMTVPILHEYIFNQQQYLSVNLLLIWLYLSLLCN